jgi:UDP-N-acetyl-D-galactosamine dehydrogenase
LIQSIFTLKPERKIAVVGLGYVGLPVALAFARAGFSVSGFDIDGARIAELIAGFDRTGEIGDGQSIQSIALSSDLVALNQSDFFILAVPTHVDEANRPDMSALLQASVHVGGALKNGDIVVYESTVYPGAIEDDCIPVLERESGLRVGQDFKVGYSPERINPGDRQHRFDNIVKVVAAQDSDTLDLIADVYGRAISADIYKAPSIRVAEAAKVIENAQRDLNVAFVNELSLIFKTMGIDTGDVLATARTKWNFLPFTPGLVGGHCIGVAPYFLAHRAERAGYHPEIILAGRRINDGMSRHIARECIRGLSRRSRTTNVVTVLGITYKENVPDIRNSKVVELLEELQAFGLTVQVTDPIVSAGDVSKHCRIPLLDRDRLRPADIVILAVPHKTYVDQGWDLVRTLLSDGRGLVLDLHMVLDRAKTPDGVDLWRP